MMKMPKSKNKKIKKIKKTISKIKKIEEIKKPKLDIKLEEEIKAEEFQEGLSSGEFNAPKLEASNIEIEEIPRQAQARVETEETQNTRERYQTIRELPYRSGIQSEQRPGAYAMRQDTEEREYSHAEEINQQAFRGTTNQRISGEMGRQSRVEPLQQDILARDELDAEREYQDRERQYKLKRRRE